MPVAAKSGGVEQQSTAVCRRPRLAVKDKAHGHQRIKFMGRRTELVEHEIQGTDEGSKVGEKPTHGHKRSWGHRPTAGD